MPLNVTRGVDWLGIRERARKQAVENALTLIFIAFFAGITWALLILGFLWDASHGK